MNNINLRKQQNKVVEKINELTNNCEQSILRCRNSGKAIIILHMLSMMKNSQNIEF